MEKMDYQSLTTWNIILFSALTAFIFRLLPFVFKRSRVLNDQTGYIYRFLNYSTQAMLGVIVFNTAFHNHGYSFIENFQFLDYIKSIILITCFIYVAKTKKIFNASFFGLIIYFASCAWLT
jgi:branched-subunit amino acid transport protein